jgi:hypothetical protein
VGARGTSWLERVVAPALELGQALSPGWYRPPLETTGGSEVARPDWFV